MVRRAIVASLVAAAALAARGGDPTPEEALTALLAKHVDGAGFVDYAGWKTQDEPALRAVVARFAAVDAARLSPAGAKAFWIDVYDAVTLEAVLAAWPVRSIKDIPDVWKAPRFAGRSLDQVEHEVLRPMKDPRVHAALNCASRGCPPLRREAYVEARLDAQLDDQVRRWLGDRERGLRVEGGVVRLSQVFSWFGEDFGPDVPARLRWCARFVDGVPADAKVEALPWDWAINSQN